MIRSSLSSRSAARKLAQSSSSSRRAGRLNFSSSRQEHSHHHHFHYTSSRRSFFGDGSSATKEEAAATTATAPTFSSYEYPLAKEQPIVTRTQASDIDVTKDKNKSPPKLAPPSTAPNDPFDDAHKLSPQEVEDIKQAQKQMLRTTLSGLVKDDKIDDATRSRSMAILEQIPAHIPPNVPADQLETPETLLTTLDNGVRVVSQETYGQVSTVGVVSSVGSRHEKESQNRGVTNLLETLAFGATTAHPSGKEVTTLLQDWGGTWFATAGREQSMHCIDLLRPNVTRAVEMLHQTLLEPLFLQEEVEDAKRALQFQNMDLPPELLLGEALQQAAFGSDQQLGQAHFCPVDQIEQLSVSTVQEYWKRQFLQNPNGIVLAGAGVRHDNFVRLAEQQFGHLQQKDSELQPTINSTYRGGQARVRLPIMDGVDGGGDPNGEGGGDAAAAAAAAAGMSDSPQGPLVRIALALPVGGWHSTSDLVPTCVLQTLLGGGNAFSAGGPGKGMYSRLYRQVLNQYAWAESAEAFTAFHGECGLWGITGSTVPHKARDMVQVFAEHLARLAIEPVGEQELNRAKNMLLCNVLTQLESRLVLFEDLGRQVLTYGHREDLQETCHKIQAVTPEDLQQLASRALQSDAPPTLASVGHDLTHVPLQEEVARWFR